MQNFIELLEKLVVADNSLRANAESEYKKMQSEGGDHVPLALFQVIKTVNIADHLRQLAAVLLRRLLIEDNDGSVYSEMSEIG